MTDQPTQTMLSCYLCGYRDVIRHLDNHSIVQRAECPRCHAVWTATDRHWRREPRNGEPHRDT